MGRRSLLIVVDSVDKFLMPPQFPDAPKEYRVLRIAVRALRRALLRLYQTKEFADACDINVFLPINMKNAMKDRSYEHQLRDIQGSTPHLPGRV